MVGLRPREKALAIGLTALAAGLSVYGFLIKPGLARVHTLQRVIPEKQQELRDLAVKTRRITILAGQLAAARQGMDSQPVVEFLPAVESAIGRQRLDTHLTAIKEQTAASGAGQGQVEVEVSLQDLSFRQVIDLLQAIQAAIPSVRIDGLHLSRHAQDPGLLDATLTLRRPQVVPDPVTSHRQGSVTASTRPS